MRMGMMGALMIAAASCGVSELVGHDPRCGGDDRRKRDPRQPHGNARATERRLRQQARKTAGSDA